MFSSRCPLGRAASGVCRVTGDTAPSTPATVPAASHWSSFGKKREPVPSQTSARSGRSRVGTAGSAAPGPRRRRPRAVPAASRLPIHGHCACGAWPGISPRAVRTGTSPTASAAQRHGSKAISLPRTVSGTQRCRVSRVPARSQAAQCPERDSPVPPRGCVRLSPEQDVVREGALPSSWTLLWGTLESSSSNAGTWGPHSPCRAPLEPREPAGLQ